MVTVRLTFLSIWENWSPQTTVEDLLSLLNQMPHYQTWEGPLMLYHWWHGTRLGNGMSFLILSTGSLLPLLCSHGRTFWFLPFFSCFYCYFFVTTVVRKTPRGWHNDSIWFPHATIEEWKLSAVHSGGYGFI